MRRRIIAAAKEPTLKAVKELDAFPKVPETYKATSATGGGISIVTFVFIAILIISECNYYSQTKMKYDYEVDKEFGQKVKINVDLTIAMKCHQIGADVVDVTGAGAETFGKLEEEETYFQLTPLQEHYHRGIQDVNSYIRNQYSAMHEILWKTGYQGMGGMPARETPPPDHSPDACRIHGSLTVNKVAGNFHITAGNVLLPLNKTRGKHVHVINNIKYLREYNFSHRIDHFSFGEVTPGVINTLDGDLKIAETHLHLFNYFIEIVPTKVDTYKAKVDTFQYAATEKNRTVDHSAGSHGVPGIFMKYDIASFKVHVRETHEPYTQFLIRLIGIVGGVFATSGLIHSLVQVLVDVVCCRYKFSSDSVQRQDSTETASLTSHQQLPANFGGQIIAPPSGGLVAPSGGDFVLPAATKS